METARGVNGMVCVCAHAGLLYVKIGKLLHNIIWLIGFYSCWAGEELQP